MNKIVDGVIVAFLCWGVFSAACIAVYYASEAVQHVGYCR